MTQDRSTQDRITQDRITQDRAPIRHLAIDDIRGGLQDGTILLVDVREPHEFAAGHIPGSESHPLSRFDPESVRPGERRVVFSCAAGIRSVRAIELAQEAGLDWHEHYEGGFREWVLAGEPIG